MLTPCYIGANSGVGYATTSVIARASENFHVILACRDLAKADKAAAEITAAGIKGKLSTVQLQVTDEDSIQKAAAWVEERFGRLDVLINNAAVGVGRAQNDKDRFLGTMETNVVGPYLVSEAFRPLLLKSEKPPYSIYVSSGQGSLSIASSVPKHPFEPPKAEPYRASKAALNMVMVLDSRDNRDKGIKVFGMCPGFVVSNLRGTTDEARTGRGMAGDPEVSANVLLRIIEGERDADEGRVVHKDGVHPW